MSSPDTVAPEVLEEGCYYLSKMGFSLAQVAKNFQITREEAERHRASYERKLEEGKVTADDSDWGFWKGVRAEAEGDTKVTFVSEKGFHHAWKSDLKKLDGPSLMAIFESTRNFVEMDPNRRFLDYPSPKGYDPLALEREAKRALGIVSTIMEEKWRKEGGKQKKSRDRGGR